jgi:hypothetical protein
MKTFLLAVAIASFFLICALAPAGMSDGGGPRALAPAPAVAAVAPPEAGSYSYPDNGDHYCTASGFSWSNAGYLLGFLGQDFKCIRDGLGATLYKGTPYEYLWTRYTAHAGVSGWHKHVPISG